MTGAYAGEDYICTYSDLYIFNNIDYKYLFACLIAICAEEFR